MLEAPTGTTPTPLSPATSSNVIPSYVAVRSRTGLLIRYDLDTPVGPAPLRLRVLPLHGTRVWERTNSFADPAAPPRSRPCAPSSTASTAARACAAQPVPHLTLLTVESPLALPVPPDVVVVDHHDSYTWNLVHLVARVTGELPTVVQHDDGTAVRPGFSHVVLSPGPGTPTDEADFAVGREVLLAGTVPVLGVCLGMQGLVTAYGGVVDRVEPAHGDVTAVTHDGPASSRACRRASTAVRYHSLAAITVPTRSW